MRRVVKSFKVRADLMGVASVTSLDWPDGTVTNSEELRETLVGLVRSTAPRGGAGSRPDGHLLW